MTSALLLRRSQPEDCADHGPGQATLVGAPVPNAATNRSYGPSTAALPHDRPPEPEIQPVLVPSASRPPWRDARREAMPLTTMTRTTVAIPRSAIGEWQRTVGESGSGALRNGNDAVTALQCRYVRVRSSRGTSTVRGQCSRPPQIT
jgi:hypothetical protein